MYRTALRLNLEWNRSDISHWSSKLLLCENELLEEIIKEQIDDMKQENEQINSILIGG